MIQAKPFGWDEAEKHLKKMSVMLPQNVEKVLDSASLKLIMDARSKAPKDTGAYAKSIRVLSKGKGWRFVGSDIKLTALGTGKSYNLGWILEFGSKAHIIRPVVSSVLFWTGGKYGAGGHFGLEVHHPGTSPYPHFEPAKLQLQKAFPNMFKIEALKIWKGTS